ncbi:hypothetical protein PR202_ga22984 [Eleusine coracana subsp. coracana]|uniref:Uncharacterized protein n=1 Tax=Eleusine coracana subsp. coracana TaxID=191504 RepID=A0AAV5D5C3_ELECO|nr:hypothetical protein PR202_ga22984 [Eleusine coracana subsp. coracana]
MRRKETYAHSCHSAATGENKTGLTTGLALALALLMVAFPSHLLLIHHRLLLVNEALLCDGLRPSDGEGAATLSRLAFRAAAW